MKKGKSKKKKLSKKRKSWKSVLVKPSESGPAREVKQFKLAQTNAEMIRNLEMMEELRSHFYNLKNLRMDKTKEKLFRRK